MDAWTAAGALTDLVAATVEPAPAVQEAAQAEPDQVLGRLDSLLDRENWGILLRAVLWLVVGVPLLLAATSALRRFVSKKYSPQQGLVAGKLVLYPGFLLILLTVLHELQFSLAPLLGAAGIVGIAVGFASQTSVSNVISGFFLIGERPFQVDDVIQVGSTVGRVLSIDTLSVKLRTFDNRFIRIPNETIVKSEVTTITRFPIRRLDLNVGVAYREHIPRVREVLLEVARANPNALMEPAPVVFFDGYGDSSLDLRLTVWVPRAQFWDVKNFLLEEIKARFDAEDIEIPFPHRTLYVGSVTDPFPLRMESGPHTAEPASPMAPSREDRGPGDEDPEAPG
ncbi:MAG: mechanosensitive ion channel family protein, partial [Gemmatimonadales bacterium]